MADFDIISGDLKNNDHAAALVKLINSYMADPMGVQAEPLNLKMASQLISGLLNHPTAIILFCKYDTEFIGAAVAFLGFSTFYAKPLLNIHDLIVLPAYRKRGAGRMLMDGCICKARELNCCKVTLEVRTDNEKAKLLYSSIGFSSGEYPMEFWTMLLV